MTRSVVKQEPSFSCVGREGAREELARLTRWPTIGAMLVTFGFVGGFVVWASLAPLAGGAVARGVISPDGSRRTIQHLEGGIIAKLLVREGDRVTAGQELVVLENVLPRARRDLLHRQMGALLAVRSRLNAERENANRVTFPPDLAKGDESIKEVMDAQEKLFQTRLAMHRTQEDVLSRRKQELEKQITGFEAQCRGVTEQLRIVEIELSDKRMLTAKGLLRKPELLQLERQRAELIGRSGDYTAQIAKAEVQIGETKLQLVALNAERTNSIATELAKVRADISAQEEQLRASEDILSRTVLTAPVSGSVVNLRFKTIGGVVRQGEPLLDVVPSEERLLIDAQISPNDIDIVHQGLPAEITLSAFPSRTTPRLSGELISVSADRTVDERTGQPYYLARVEVDQKKLETLTPRPKLVPGMPADVLIVTEHRTMVEYIMEPLLTVVRKSFRES